MFLKEKQLLTRGVEEVIVKNNLEKVLSSGKKLRVKFGIDPTMPDLHLGHLVALRKLRQFQDAGHKIILIIGDFTARVGDPSGRSAVRQPLTDGEIKNNFKKYLNQAGKILDLKKIEVRYNSEWFKKSDALEAILKLAQASTVNQVLQRSEFKERLKNKNEISLLEALYPLFQGYDSVVVRADVEIGGTDQKFNLLMGRQVQKYFKMAEQGAILLPLLEGTDGVRKMSKTYGNYIALDERSNEMLGKIMSIPDKLLKKYLEVLTDINPLPIKLIKNNPREAKLLLAETIVSDLYNKKIGKSAKANFIQVFSRKEKPSKMKNIKIKETRLSLIELLLKAGVKSKGEARRLIEQGGVKIDNQAKADAREIIKISGDLELKIGKKNFFRVKHD